MHQNQEAIEEDETIEFQKGDSNDFPFPMLLVSVGLANFKFLGIAKWYEVLRHRETPGRWFAFWQIVTKGGKANRKMQAILEKL